MIDKPSAVALLDRLRSEISSLHTKPRLGDDFHQWQREVLDALERIFGSDSDETREFRNIHFEMNPETLDRFREQLGTSLQGRFGIVIPSDFEIPHDHYYQERLYEAAEFLLAMIIALRYRGNDSPR